MPSKPSRQQIYEKYDGHCAYCGKTITIKEMQVDHVIPKRSYSMIHKCLIVNGHKFTEYGLNDYRNLMPSCRSCNHYKRALSLEGFRNEWLGGLCSRMKKLYTVKVAIDYGIVTLNEWDRKFYFEKTIQSF